MITDDWEPNLARQMHKHLTGRSIHVENHLRAGATIVSQLTI